LILHKSLALVLIIVFPLTVLELPAVRATIPTQTIVAHLFEQPGTSTYICNTFTLQYKNSIGNFIEHTENICGTIDAVVQKDNVEQDPTADYYAVDVSMNAKNGTSYPSVYADAPPGPPGIWVTYSRLDITVPSGAVGLQFSPTSHTISSPNQPSISVSFCAQGEVAGTCLTISGLGPTQTIQQANNQANDYSWSTSESAPCCTTIFGSQDDFLMIFAVPEGLSFSLGISAALKLTYFDNYSCNLVDGSDCYNTINLSGTVSVPAPNFSFSGPSLVNLSPGQTTSVTLTLASQPSFEGTVYLSDSYVPSGFTTLFSSNQVTIGGGSISSVTYTISVPSSASGNYRWNVNANTNAGTLISHSVSIGNDPDFSMSSSSTFVTIVSPGGPFPQTQCDPNEASGPMNCPIITVQSNGLADSISFSASLPSTLQYYFTVNPLNAPSGGGVTSSMFVITDANNLYTGTSTITLTARDNYGNVHTLSITLDVETGAVEAEEVVAATMGVDATPTN
jgi:hypothetical protein